MSKIIKVYMCTTDWNTELPLGAQDVKIVTNLKHFKKTRTCWKECGIIEVQLKLNKVIKKGSI